MNPDSAARKPANIKTLAWAFGLAQTHSEQLVFVWRRYVIPVLCVLVAFGIRYALEPVLGEELPFMLFIAAALIAASYGGAIAGILSLLLGLFLADHFFLLHAKQDLGKTEVVLYVVRYLFTASLGIALIEVLHRSRRKLEDEVARRTESENALAQAKSQLSQHARELELVVAERTNKLAGTVESLQGVLYQIAHSLRAPLRAMQGYTTVLMEEYSSELDSTAQDYTRHICDASERMDELIRDLLQYGRLGHFEPQLTSVPLQPVIQRALFRLAYEIKNSRAEVKVAGLLPAVLADPAVLEEVLTNLIENALKFVQAGTPPRLELTAERRKSVVRLWLRDNGVGIEPQYHERIFGIFETLYPEPANTGTGIGLAIVKKGIERMRGRVGLESQAGAGSRFWVELPSA